MKTRYSKTTGSFYPLDITYPNLPADIIEVSQADFDAAMARPSGHSFDFVGDKLVISEPLPLTLTDLKLAKNAEINASRLKANYTTFPYGGKQIACDELSRGDIDVVQAKVARSGKFPVGFPGGWKAIDNSIVMLTDVTAWDDFYDAMAAQGTANFNKSQTLKSQLASATTIAQVAAINW